MTANTYRLRELLPHTDAMMLLDELVRVSDGGVHARTRGRRDGLFAGAREDGVPAWLGLEYLVQAIAAWSGFRALEQGRTVHPPLLVGARSFHSNVGTLPCDRSLDIEAERVLGDRDGISVFDGRISTDGIEQHARLKVYLPDDLEHDLKDGTDD